MIYTAADLHLFHKKILQFQSHTRPFQTIDEMHVAINQNWNNKITPEDTIYLLGDISFGGATATAEILNQLNGNKILITGNHDSGYLGKSLFVDCFTEIHNYLEIQHNGYKIVMFHFPIMWWNLKHYGSLHLHGHLHGNPSMVPGRIKDVGMDTNHCTPYLLDDVIEELLQIPLTVDHHGREIMP